ncbi:MAG: LuxR C-terminal-related transcriptional regulator [Pseudomonadota bacterium]
MPISDAFLTAALKTISDPISIISPSYRIIWANDATLTHFNVGLDELTGSLCHEVYLDKPGICPECPLEPVFHSGEPHTMEKFFLKKTGSLVWREIRAYPIRDHEGNMVAAIRIGFDITQRKLIQGRHLRRIDAFEQALHELSEGNPNDGTPTDQWCLTRREEQVLKLLASGLTNREIGGILRISPHTVKSHVNHLFNKLAVSRRSEAGAAAVRLGLI